ncbi:hypothetical protein [Nitrospira moscoviensis]|uniref:Uncharacterized protein n=1 Tax=Nitrospira moscoviensis TaxID=42253 RepID=A0A0K2G8F2_NITMO|nr:hypothetical protein [Nitrospira moscoviensis]ALA57215.1 exported protein of unknown function [Nitrospira moscoviensis]
MLNEKTGSMIIRFLGTPLLLFCFSMSGAFAETKTLTTEGTYIMGDGETPDFAETRALQKAKQAALEEAGTYVQSYTKVQNLDLTTEEIQTVTGGLLQVEVLEKTRSLVDDGLRFHTKIKARVTTDKMEELAQRIKGNNVVAEYTQLQAEYTRLSRELEGWKQRAAKAPQGPARDAMLSQIRDEAKVFARVQQREADLLKRLVSGEQLVESVSRDKDIIDDLLKTIEDRGLLVKVGDIKAVAVSGQKDVVAVKVPISIQVSETLYETVFHVAQKLEGTVRFDVRVWFPHGPSDQQSLRIGERMSSEATVTLVRLGRYLETAQSFQDKVANLAFLVTFEGTRVPTEEMVPRRGTEPFQCYLGGKATWEGRDSFQSFLYGYFDDDWFPLRRIFPVGEVFGEPPLYKYPRIDNGWYDKARACKEARVMGVSCRFWQEPPVVKQGMPDVPGRDGYVAIVRDETNFVATMQLHQDFVKEMTGISVRVVSDEYLPRNSPHCGIAQ